MNIKQYLSTVFLEAFEASGYQKTDVMLQNSQKLGDYQVNGCMRLAKRYQQSPIEIASNIISWLQQSNHTQLFAKLEVAAPGFINVFLSNDWLAKCAAEQLVDNRCGIALVRQPDCVVVDYSSPNLAKEMHVGHVRSTVIGDAIARILEYQGHRVIRQNHMGDWGTQFGMLIAELQELNIADGEAIELSDLEQFYRCSKRHFDSDAEFADKSRSMVVALQAGDEQCLSLWQRFIDISIAHAHSIYRQLGVTLTQADVMAESAYNDQLATIVSELQQTELLVEDKGAKVVVLDEFKNRQGEALAVIIQKQDGGYLYMTTDLASIKYRLKVLKANRLLYFIDARQSLHMRQLFTLAKKIGWVDQQQLEHCAFGTIMGSDGKPFKTREGDVVKLQDLLDEAIQRATNLVKDKSPTLTRQQQRQIGSAVGIGAVKYADLSKTRTNDYIFDWDHILSFEGNTAPYLQYAYTRIVSLIAKSGYAVEQPIEAINWVLEQPIERQLQLKLLQFPEIVQQVGDNTYPHELCTYLYEVASHYMKFYEQCQVLSVRDDAIKLSRIALCQLSSKILKLGLSLLGIETLQKM